MNNIFYRCANPTEKDKTPRGTKDEENNFKVCKYSDGK